MLKFQNALNELERLKTIRKTQLAEHERAHVTDPAERTMARIVIEKLRRDIRELEEASEYLVQWRKEGQYSSMERRIAELVSDCEGYEAAITSMHKDIAKLEAELKQQRDWNGVAVKSCKNEVEKLIAAKARVKELEERIKEAHQITLYSESKDMNIQAKAVKWLRKSEDIVFGKAKEASDGLWNAHYQNL